MLWLATRQIFELLLALDWQFFHAAPTLAGGLRQIFELLLALLILRLLAGLALHWLASLLNSAGWQALLMPLLVESSLHALSLRLRQQLLIFELFVLSTPSAKSEHAVQSMRATHKGPHEDLPN